MKHPMKARVSACALVLVCALARAQSPIVEEVPFVTTPDNVTLEMLRLAEVKSGDYLMDLGSGDGRIVINAARRFGARGLGVEIVPDLVVQSRESAAKAGVGSMVEFREQDLFKTDLSPATVITMYLLPEVNLQLRPSILKLRPGTRVVSHDWDMGDWKPDRSLVVEAPDKKIGREKKSTLHLWIVPARVDGAWCGEGVLRGTRLELQQKYQEFSGSVVRKGRSNAFAGKVRGAQVVPTEGSKVDMVFEAAGDKLRLVSGTGVAKLIRGATLAKSQGPRCQ